MKTGRSHRRNLLISSILLALSMALPVAAAQPPAANKPKTVTVMTRNLYVGADLLQAFAAIAGGDPTQIIAAVSETWAKVKFTDFPARAEELAREISESEPDLIGLQEAELWRSQTPADFVMGNARHVEYDFVEILLDALKARGLRYEVVAEEIGFDAEFPGFLSPSAKKLSDIRLTDREVILARTDIELSNPQTGHFATNIEVPISPGFTFVLQRGWASVDAHVRDKTFRFVTTHLEADSEEVREAQAIEILLGPADTALPVILVADANSNANGDATTAAYSFWRAAGFADAWLEALPAKPQVSTCCADELLLSSDLPVGGDDEGRLDLVLYRGAGDFTTLDIGLLGNDAATDKVFNGLAFIWPSDHAGVAARLQISKE